MPSKDDDQPIQTPQPTSQPPEAAAGGAAGAPPSNTAPATSNTPLDPITRILAAGVDSLYLSYRGSLRPSVENLLRTIKDQAQSRDAELRALAQFPVGDYLFEVSDKGSRRFAFVLTDTSYRIELSKSSAESLPLAHVQISSAALAAYGVEQCVRELTSILVQLGTVDGDPTVSRADLFADSLTDWDLSRIEDEQWVTRAHDVARYGNQGKRSGYTVGRGGDLSLRLYDKVLEILRHGKAHATRAWKLSGWDGEQAVWRAEVQFRRNVLREMGVQSVPDLLTHSSELWHYALEKWCRLAVPTADDQTRSRWPTHPFWSAVTNAGDFHAVGSVGRRWLRLSRAPSDARLVDMFIGSITSYMAKYGETSMAWALRDVLGLCHVVLAQRAETTEIEPSRHVASKVAEKTRRFGSGRAYRVPQRIDLTLDTNPRQEGLDYDAEDDEE
jgi:hypothetical protein